MVDKFCQYLDIRKNERILVFSILLTSFFYGLAIVFFQSSSSALFLSHYDNSMVAVVITASSLLNVCLGVLYTVLERYLQPMNLFLSVSFFLFSSIIILWLLLFYFEIEWIIFITLLWKNVFAIFFSLQFWGLNSVLFNIQQSKRLFGILGLGEVIGGITAGIATPSIVRFTNPVNLLLLAGICMTGVFFMNIYIKRISRIYYKKQNEVIIEKKTSSFFDLLKNQYLTLIAFIGILATFLFYFTDYLFLDAIQTLLVNTEAISSFMGVYAATSYSIGFIYRVFFSGPLYQRFGIAIGLILMPYIVLAAITAGVFFSALSFNFYYIFGAITLGRISQSILTNALHRPTFLILYKPLPKYQRLAAQANVDGIILPAAGAFSGLALILLTKYFSLGMEALMLICAVILVSWLIFAKILKKEYISLIQSNLAFRITSFLESPIDNKKNIAILENSLNSAYPGDVLYALEILATVNASHLKDYCASLIAHPAPLVRSHILNTIEKQNFSLPKEVLLARFKEEPSWELQGQLLKLLCRQDNTRQTLSWAMQFLNSTHFALVKGAIVGLIYHRGTKEASIAENNLLDITKNPNANLRELAAQTLGEIGSPDFYQLLIPLIQDEDKNVRIAALAAAGKLEQPALWPPLIRAFLNGPERAQAALSIENCGDKIIPQLIQSLSDDSNEAQLAGVFMICSKIMDPSAAAFLLSHCSNAVPSIRLSALQNLFQSQFICGIPEKKEMRARIVFELKVFKQILHAIISLEAQGDEVILRALHTDAENCKMRIFLLYSFIYPTSAYKTALRYVQTKNLELRDHAIQLLDDILSTQDKFAVIPLMENLPPEKMLHALNGIIPNKRSKHEAIMQISKNASHYFSLWSQSYALYLLANEMPSTEMRQMVLDYTLNKEPFLAETASWVHEKWSASAL